MRIVGWLARYYPITAIVIEDVAAITKPGKRRWRGFFSSLAIGKIWCYEELERLAPVMLVRGQPDEGAA